MCHMVTPSYKGFWENKYLESHTAIPKNFRVLFSRKNIDVAIEWTINCVSHSLFSSCTSWWNALHFKIVIIEIPYKINLYWGTNDFPFDQRKNIGSLSCWWRKGAERGQRYKENDRKTLKINYWQFPGYSIQFWPSEWNSSYKISDILE